jgi:aspartate kinase
MTDTIQVFKFGGASVKDADGIRNVLAILRSFSNQRVVAVVSASGKTTNALEKVLHNARNAGAWEQLLEEVFAQHFLIADELHLPENHSCRSELRELHQFASVLLKEKCAERYQWLYDQLVSLGELLSQVLLSAALEQENMPHERWDARRLILTDHAYTEAGLRWSETEAALRGKLASSSAGLYLIHGFIGSAPDGSVTTLGREGSDYTAAVVSYCLQATKMTIWKDVPGVMNADPKEFPEAVFIPELSYLEAIEMAYYGAKLIHPKTIKPLQNGNISLEVRSFLQPATSGTLVRANADTAYLPPIIVLKHKQVLLSFSALDFGFIAEDHLSVLFRAFATQRLHINLMQNAAISFSVCTDDKPEKLQQLIQETRRDFAVTIYRDLTLLTIRHHNDTILQKLTDRKEILVRQNSRHTAQVLMR